MEDVIRAFVSSGAVPAPDAAPRRSAAHMMRISDLLHGELKNCCADSEAAKKKVEELTATGVTVRQAEIVCDLIFAATRAAKGETEVAA